MSPAPSAPAGLSPRAAARFFRVLGDATRLRLLALLQDREEMAVGELVAEVGQPQPRVSTHLACLRHCGFVTAERRGKEVVYRLALDGLEAVLLQATEVMSPIGDRLATCTRIGPDWV
jgi:ArsR family transcriptional regulator